MGMTDVQMAEILHTAAYFFQKGLWLWEIQLQADCGP